MALPLVHNLGPNSTGLPGLMLKSDPVGLWIPQHGWVDQSPYGYHGTATNVTYSGEGPFARMPVVPGVFDAANNSVVNVGTLGTLGSQNVISFECWFKTTMTAIGSLMQACDSGAGNPDIMLVAVNSNTGGGAAAGKIRFLGRGGNVTNAINVVTTNIVHCNDGNWHHIVTIVNHSAATAVIYFDGVSVPIDYQANAPVETPTNWDGQVVFGNFVYSNIVGQLASNAYRYTGSIAMAAFYPRALFDYEVKAHYLVGVNGP